MVTQHHGHRRSGLRTRSITPLLRVSRTVARWRRRIDESRYGPRVVIWGGGAKGVMFANLLRVTAGAGIDWVVDVNPRKQGHFIPLTGQQIVGPDCLLRTPRTSSSVMNPEYEPEIRSMIAEIGIDAETVVA